MAMNYPRPPEIYGIAQSHSPPNTDESGSLTQGHPSKNSPDHRAAKRTKVDGNSIRLLLKLHYRVKDVTLTNVRAQC